MTSDQQHQISISAQAVSQENLEQLRANNGASSISQMELRMRDLESELLKIRASQEDSNNETELENYKRLCLEKSQVIKSLSNKLRMANEELAAAEAQHLVEKQRNSPLPNSRTTRRVLVSSTVVNPDSNLMCSRNLISRGTLVLPSSISRPLNSSTENDVFQTQLELIRNISRELSEVATEFGFLS
ncbi:ankyrin repeat domain-containing protein 26-like [Tupaia chinensis]|uniref:ankyrin repeat domain-containing protein 26-like n=1 Tax=Tupaia chinensis TaxID=246437 RepID=UPI000FFC86F0|nr:ankyrin repeat domain-containing protein 26-like [Tupaia chinensis]